MTQLFRDPRQSFKACLQIARTTAPLVGLSHILCPACYACRCSAGTGSCKIIICMQVHDRMTEQVYVEPLKSFVSPVTPGPVFTVPVLEQGRRALEEINEELGLAFDEQACHL